MMLGHARLRHDAKRRFQSGHEILLRPFQRRFEHKATTTPPLFFDITLDSCPCLTHSDHFSGSVAIICHSFGNRAAVP